MAHGEHEPFLGAESPSCGSSRECGTIPGMRDKLCFLRTGIFPKDMGLARDLAYFLRTQSPPASTEAFFRTGAPSSPGAPRRGVEPFPGIWSPPEDMDSFLGR